MERFFTFLENLRGMPDDKKRAFSFGGAASITVLIFAVWVGSFVSSINTPGTSTLAAVEASGGLETLPTDVSVSPFATIKDAIIGSIEKAKKQIAEISELGKIEVENIFAAVGEVSTTSLSHIERFEMSEE